MQGLPEDYPHQRGDVHAFSTFNFEAYHVRVIDMNSEPWFVGLDVCEALGHRNTKHALSRLDDDERTSLEIADALGRLQPTTVINEAGVWRLVLTSRVEGAEAFKHYLVHEILPRWRRGKLAELPGQAPATPAPLPDTAMKAADDYLAAARAAGYSPDYIARVARWRAQVALGKNVPAPRPPKLAALPAPVQALPAPEPARVAQRYDFRPLLGEFIRYVDGREVHGWVKGRLNPDWFPAKRQLLRDLGYVVPAEVYNSAFARCSASSGTTH